MLPRCFVLCTLILAPSLTIAQSTPSLSHFGRNLAVAPNQTIENATCFLCSVAVDGQVNGSVHVFAGDVFLNGRVAGDVVVFGGNLSLTSSAVVDGHMLIFGGHLHQDPAAMPHPATVISALVFLPLILTLCLVIGALIVLARRMVRGPIAYPPLPRL
ncbi:MAG TPA: polymer-forming cytoskeletal protein [Acidobacteriaceae bacterium]|nr:polymer-forming cytoskeletal protein [Acidobacteriaceae bacterium]